MALLHCKYIVICIVILLCSSVVYSSEGDRDPHFSSCLQLCQSQCFDDNDRTSQQQQYNKLHKQLHSSKSPITAIQSNDLPILYQYMFWSCSSNCEYQCMWHNIEYRVQYNLPTVKYYGKWPFIRVFGIQELFSVLFSICNALPHIYGYNIYKKEISNNYRYKRLWLSYSLISINTWLWSSVFHTRDILITERLDYYCASLGIVYASIVTLIRILNIKNKVYMTLIYTIWLTLFIMHISYLQFVHFDYGYNMTVSLLSGVLYSLMWVIWCTLNRDRPYVYKMYTCTLLLWLAALCEVFDFPPFFYLLDAHSIWHGLTPPITVLFYSFLLNDAKYELDKSNQKIR